MKNVHAECPCALQSSNQLEYGFACEVWFVHFAGFVAERDLSCSKEAFSV